MANENPQPPLKTRIRWWPAALLLVLSGGLTIWVSNKDHWTFQDRNLWTLSIAISTFLLLLVWWLALSRTPRRQRIWVAVAVLAVVGVGASLFRIRGFSGDVLPVLEPRWTSQQSEQPAATPRDEGTLIRGPDFPQFLGPNRNAMIQGPALSPDWHAHPPRVLWRQPIGAAWSGWAIVGGRAFTQEQRAEGECVTAYDALTGQLAWLHADPVHYRSPLAGEGPRCTPTVVGNRVFTLGATGILNCLDSADGKVVWARDIVRDATSKVPEWGFAGSPLVLDGRVYVSAGGEQDRSMLAYHAESGEIVWAAGTRRTSYGSLFAATLAGRRHILAFNSRQITAHDPDLGTVLWEYPWGRGEPQVSVPMIVNTNRILFSSAYGVGSELLEVNEGTGGELTAMRVWQSKKLKSKFGTLLQKDGFAYGLDDGVLACVSLQDGAQRWKGLRYGHGQALLVNDLMLLMAENGELVLLEPSPEVPRELHRIRAFQGKTWNPFAVSGELLLARTEREALCLRLKCEPSAGARATVETRRELARGRRELVRRL